MVDATQSKGIKHAKGGLTGGKDIIKSMAIGMIQPPGSLKTKYSGFVVMNDAAGRSTHLRNLFDTGVNQSTICLWYRLMSTTSTNRTVRPMIQAAVYKSDKFQSTFEYDKELTNVLLLQVSHGVKERPEVNDGFVELLDIGGRGTRGAGWALVGGIVRLL